jgi:hypothetical protein
MYKKFTFFFIIFCFSFLSQNSISSERTYVLEYFNNICLIEAVPGSGNLDPSCNAQNYPEEDPNDSNMRYRVQPDGNKQTWAVYEIQADGSKKMVQHFYLNNAQSANPDYSYVDVTNGNIYLYTNEGYAIYNPSDNTVTITNDGYVESNNNGVIFRDVNISDIIREEPDGSIHIGENSLVTIEEDGKQQFYAVNANGDQIDINIKKGSDLLVDGRSVSQAITDVATNKTNIATNTQAIASLGTRVDGLNDLVNTFDQRITDLQTLTGTMMSEYRSGIASSVALSQIRYASKGFSIGVGQGEFKDKDEMAVGIGYGGEFNDRVGYQFQFGSSGDTSGFGFTITF